MEENYTITFDENGLEYMEEDDSVARIFINQHRLNNRVFAEEPFNYFANVLSGKEGYQLLIDLFTFSTGIKVTKITKQTEEIIF